MELDSLMEFVEKYAKQQKGMLGELKDKEKLILSSTVKISEELGELCDQVLSHNSRQREEKMGGFNKDSLSEEFADTILAVLMLARDMNVNIEEALAAKIKKLKEKYCF
jgi:NTP pyrophosphatase (non-canonical NTP hydrolase)